MCQFDFSLLHFWSRWENWKKLLTPGSGLAQLYNAAISGINQLTEDLKVTLPFKWTNNKK